MVADNRPKGLGGNNQPPQRPFFVRLLIALLKLIGLILVIGIGVALALAAWQQYQLLDTQNSIRDRRIDGLESNQISENEVRNIVQSMIADGVSGDVTALDDSIDELDDSVSAQETMLASQMADLEALSTAQAELSESLDLLQGQVDSDIEGVLSSLEETGETDDQLEREMALRSQSVVRVQQSITDLETQIETLQTELADIQAQMTVTTTAAAVEEAPAEPVEEEAEAEDSESTDAETAVAPAASLVDFRYVRLYGLVIRSKVHINEGDLEAAAAAITNAQGAVAELADGADESLSESLAVVTENLDLAAESLESKPTLSNIALDDAWTAMDELLNLLATES